MAENSGIMKGGVFVSEQEWERHVSLLEQGSGRISKEDAKQELKQRIVDAVERRVPKGKFGLFLSGGVDSSLIALVLKERLKKDFVCFSVGIENSRDLEHAERLAGVLDLDLKSKVLALDEAEKTIEESAGIIGVPDAVNIGVGAVEIAAAKLGLKEGVRVFFSGLGSEEIFAGYQRHAEADDVNAECWRGLKKMHARDLVRDSKICSELKVSFLTPYLDPDLIKAAMAVDGRHKIDEKEKKIILRECALEMGLPEDFAFRKKIAAQYGSGFDKVIGVIARKKGFKYKREYLQSLF